MINCGTVVAVGNVVAMARCGVGETAVSDSGAQAFKTKKKVKQKRSNREFILRTPNSS